MRLAERGTVSGRLRLAGFTVAPRANARRSLVVRERRRNVWGVRDVRDCASGNAALSVERAVSGCAVRASALDVDRVRGLPVGSHGQLPSRMTWKTRPDTSVVAV